MQYDDYKNYFATSMAKIWKQPDLDALKTIAHKNAEALMAANHIFLGSFQAMAKRQSETLQHIATKGTELCKHCTCSTSPDSLYNINAECICEMMENITGTVRGMMEMSSKAALEMFDIYSKRACEAKHEFAATTQADK